MVSKTEHQIRREFRAARKESGRARTWRYNQEYEDALQVRETDPARFNAMSGSFRTAVLGYYLPGREAAEKAGRDMTKGGSR